MANILIYLICNFIKLIEIIKSKISDIEDKINIFYLTFSDPSYIQNLIKKGFNYDLKKQEHSKQDIWFFFRVIWFVTTWLALSYQIYGTWYYWSDQGQILRFGIFLPGMGFPREVITTLAIIVQWQGVLNLTSSVKIMTHNPNIHSTMAPLRAICNGSSQMTSISRAVVSQVRVDIRPVVALVRILTVLNSIVFFFLALFSFILHIQEPISYRAFLIITAWSILYMVVVNQSSSSSLGLFVTMATLSRLTRLVVKNSIQLETEELSSSSSSSSRCRNAGAKKVFLAMMAEQVEVVNWVRTWSTFLNLIIGLNLTFLLSIATIGTFVCVAYEYNIAYVAGIPLVIFCWISFTIIIHLVSDVPVTINQANVQMSRMADKIAWLPGERVRVNRTLSAMIHWNGFSAFGFTPQINRAMMITVRFTLYYSN